MTMNSPTKLNYEVRPCKFAERTMLLAALQTITNKFEGKYQYVGFGGLTFTDFKLFHSNLHIDIMHSIEGGKYSEKRLKYNSPYGFIQIHKGMSSMELTKINFDNKTIVWLDYDGVIEDYTFSDLSLLIRKMPIGSVYIISCNRELKNQENNLYSSVDEFLSRFRELAPSGLKMADLSASNDYKTIRKMLNKAVKNAVNDRNLYGETVKFKLLFDIIYQENHGAKMYTFGGIILDQDYNEQQLEINDFPFIYKGGDDAYKIDVPNITLKESLLLNSCIGDENYEEKIKDIITVADYNKYIKIYKYLPRFFDVRL